jgi:hypothetical protein
MGGVQLDDCVTLSNDAVKVTNVEPLFTLAFPHSSGTDYALGAAAPVAGDAIRSRFDRLRNAVLLPTLQREVRP